MFRETTMAQAAFTAVFPYSPPAGASTVARFQSLSTADARRAYRIADSDQHLFETHTSLPYSTEIVFGTFCLLSAQFLLLEGGKPVRLGSRALEMLIVLLERPGELISNQELMARVWPNLFVEPANITVHMSTLRRTLRDGRDGNRFIINVPGRGYRFVGSIDVRGRERQHMGAARSNSSLLTS